MQHGMLSSLLLSVSLISLPIVVSAKEMQSLEVEQWLQDTYLVSKVAKLLEDISGDDIERVERSLDQLTALQQEVVRLLLLEKLEQQSTPLTEKLCSFVQSQLGLTPSYQVLEYGDGYEFSVPAFNFPVVASRILKRWKQDKGRKELALQAERYELNLKTWLSEKPQLKKSRESLLINELEHFSPEALNELTKQLTESNVTSWLPSTPVVVRLAQLSRDSSVYDMLWRMRADYHGQTELLRLSESGDDFSLQQIMNATVNPTLKPYAIKLLTKIEPKPLEVEQFLNGKVAVPVKAKFAQGESDQIAPAWVEATVSGSRQPEDG